MDERLSTVQEVATTFRIGRTTVRRWVAEGKLEAVQVGRTVRIKTSSVEKLFEQPGRKL